MDDYTARRYDQALYYALGWNHAQPTYRTMVNPTRFAEFYANRSAENGTIQDELAVYLNEAPVALVAV